MDVGVDDYSFKKNQLWISRVNNLTVQRP
jgi:hypothetical protein